MLYCRTSALIVQELCTLLCTAVQFITSYYTTTKNMQLIQSIYITRLFYQDLTENYQKQEFYKLAWICSWTKIIVQLILKICFLTVVRFGLALPLICQAYFFPFFKIFYVLNFFVMKIVFMFGTEVKFCLANINCIADKPCWTVSLIHVARSLSRGISGL